MKGDLYTETMLKYFEEEAHKRSRVRGKRSEILLSLVEEISASWEVDASHYCGMGSCCDLYPTCILLLSSKQACTSDSIGVHEGGPSTRGRLEEDWGEERHH